MKPIRKPLKFVFIFVLIHCFKLSNQENCPGPGVNRYYNPSNYGCYSAEECNFIDENHISPYCLSSCGVGSGCSHRYHDYNSKKCISQCGAGNPNNIYKSDDSGVVYICYSSCAEISYKEYIYEEKDSSTTIKNCYKTKPSSGCPVYYKKLDGVRKCTTQVDCNNKGLKYYLGDECRDSCEDYYQINITESYNIIRCFMTLDDALKNTTYVKFCHVN